LCKEEKSFAFCENMHHILRQTATRTFVTSSKSQLFRETHFAQVSDTEWNDWRWQMRNGVRSLRSVEKMFVLQPGERQAIQSAAKRGFLPMSVSPYYASLLDPVDANQPLRRTVIPVMAESDVAPFETEDPLDEDRDSVVPGLVHRYPDRVLFLATKICSTYCRYCTRSRLVGESGQNYNLARDKWDAALNYIREHSEVRDVLVSGGDPLTMSDESLATLLGELRKIQHVQFIRIGTKVPAVLPQRITPELLHILRGGVHDKPAWLSINFAHVDELTEECAEACRLLADAGLPLGGQTVLMRGVNDSVDHMHQLFQKMLTIRVRPYYMYQLDPVRGTSHFRTTVQTGLDIMKGLCGHTTGYAIPSYVVDAPGGGGKIRLLPDSIISQTSSEIILKNFEDKHFVYSNQ
jgi:lysine 2,3-aminomutase